MLIPKAMWDKALDEVQGTVPWYDYPFALREFARIMAGVRR
jgi:hypothetical protein